MSPLDENIVGVNNSIEICLIREHALTENALVLIEICLCVNLSMILNMWLNISKGTSCQKTRFWVMGMQSQNISKYSPKVNFEISHTSGSSILNLKVTWRIWCKNSVFISKLTSELPNTNTLYRFPNFKSLLLKINFSPICYDILNRFAKSQEQNVRFQKCLHQNWGERTAI